MKTPTDNPRRPARPTRRFSAMQPAVRRRAGTEDVENVEDAGADDAGVDDLSGAAAAASPAQAPSVDVDPAPRTEQVDAEAPAAAPTPAKARKTKKPASAAVAPAEAEEAGKGGDEARVAKVMSRAGLCSRRDAEAWILAGRVAVNGSVIASPALNVGPGDQVTVDGYPIEKPEHTRLLMFHKTRGLVTTARDPEGRPTIYDALPDDLPRLMTVGRLDINTEGLLLLTNDGGLARLLELPSTGWLRRYRVRANGRVDQSQLDALAKGVTVDGVDYVGIDAKLDRIQGANLWLTLGLREGKNREVKRVLEHLGLAVTRLIRLSFGPFQLGDLPENAVAEVPTRILRDQLGTALAKQAGLDFGPAEPAVAPSPRPAAPEPRRKTSRSATADRKGRAVPVERIASVGRGAPDDGARSRPGGRRVQRAEPGERAANARPDGGLRRGRGGDAGSERPARTLRQADAEPRRAADQRREPRRGERETRSDETGGQRRDARSPAARPVARKPRGSEERGGEPRFDKAARPRTGRFDERSRDSRSEARNAAPQAGKGAGSRRDGPGGQRAGTAGSRESAGGPRQSAGGLREGGAARRPDGKPPFKGGGRPTGGKPQRPGGGGRGRPRG